MRSIEGRRGSAGRGEPFHPGVVNGEVAEVDWEIGPAFDGDQVLLQGGRQSVPHAGAVGALEHVECFVQRHGDCLVPPALWAEPGGRISPWWRPLIGMAS